MVERIFESLPVLLCFFLLLLKATHACSCIPVRTEMESIKSSYCDSNNENVYSGTVIAATCNCIPEGNASINCQRYQLEIPSSLINASVMSRGKCSRELYDSEFTPLCSELGNSLVTWGLSVEGPRPSIDIPLRNLEHITRCNYSCPFNLITPYQSQPCTYTVRVGEVYKGNYSTGDEVEETGPDVLTSCGTPNRILTVSSQYIVGIGGACLAIDDWTLSRTYLDSELDYLVSLSTSEEPVCANGFKTLPSHFTSSVIISLIIFLFLI